MTDNEKQKRAEAKAQADAYYEKLKADCPILWRDPPEKGWWPQPSTPAVWDDVVYECSVKLEKLINEHKSEIPEDDLPYVVQVKEKFGGLRFYTNGGHESISEEMGNIIGEAESGVRNLCTKCGCSEAKVRDSFIEHLDVGFGWIIVLCELCWRKESIRRAKTSGSKEVRKWFYETMIAKKAGK